MEIPMNFRYVCRELKCFLFLSLEFIFALYSLAIRVPSVANSYTIYIYTRHENHTQHTRANTHIIFRPKRTLYTCRIVAGTINHRVQTEQAHTSEQMNRRNSKCSLSSADRRDRRKQEQKTDFVSLQNGERDINVFVVNLCLQ